MRYSSDFRANISSSVDKVLPLKVINERKKSVVYEDIANVAMRVLYEDEFEPINPNLQERFDALLEFLDTIPESDAKKEFIRCLNSNPSIIAIMFGFNYMERRTAQSRNHDIVLDRSLLVAPRSNAQMFLDNSVDFKNGVLDTITLEEIYQDKQIKENAK